MLLTKLVLIIEGKTRVKTQWNKSNFQYFFIETKMFHILPNINKYK